MTTKNNSNYNINNHTTTSGNPTKDPPFPFTELPGELNLRLVESTGDVSLEELRALTSSLIAVNCVLCTIGFYKGIDTEYRIYQYCVTAWIG